MTTLTVEVIDQMNKADLRTAAKARGIKYGNMSLMQIRDALKAQPEEIEMPAATKKTAAKKKAVTKKATKVVKKAKEGTSKMDLALDILSNNKNVPRKDVLKLFQEKAGLTKAGSATYYVLCKKKLGIK